MKASAPIHFLIVPIWHLLWFDVYVPPDCKISQQLPKGHNVYFLATLLTYYFRCTQGLFKAWKLCSLTPFAIENILIHAPNSGDHLLCSSDNTTRNLTIKTAFNRSTQKFCAINVHFYRKIKFIPLCLFKTERIREPETDGCKHYEQISVLLQPKTISWSDDNDSRSVTSNHHEFGTSNYYEKQLLVKKFLLRDFRIICQIKYLVKVANNKADMLKWYIDPGGGSVVELHAKWRFRSYLVGVTFEYCI